MYTSKRQLIVLQDVDDNYAPPERPVLIVEAASGTVFLTIANYNEDGKNRNMEKVAAVAVRSSDLLDAVRFVQQ